MNCFDGCRYLIERERADGEVERSCWLDCRSLSLVAIIKSCTGYEAREKAIKEEKKK